MDNYNLENEAMSDEELDEALESYIGMSLDDFAKIYNNDNSTAFLNIERQNHLKLSYVLLRKILKGDNFKITYKLHEPHRSMGVISVVGKKFSFEHGRVFADIAKLASNVDVYPKVDGTVQVDFTYHGLTMKI